jgi:hypothetical protein
MRDATPIRDDPTDGLIEQIHRHNCIYLISPNSEKTSYAPSLWPGANAEKMTDVENSLLFTA